MTGTRSITGDALRRIVITSSTILVALMLLERSLKGAQQLPFNDEYQSRPPCVVDFLAGANFRSPLNERLVLAWSSLLFDINVLPSVHTSHVCLQVCPQPSEGSRDNTVCTEKCWLAEGLPLHKASDINVVVDIPATGNFTAHVYVMRQSTQQTLDFRSLLPLQNDLAPHVKSFTPVEPSVCEAYLATIEDRGLSAHFSRPFEVTAVGLVPPKGLLYQLKPTIKDLMDTTGKPQTLGYRSPIGAPVVPSLQFPALKRNAKPGTAATDPVEAAASPVRGSRLVLSLEGEGVEHAAYPRTAGGSIPVVGSVYLELTDPPTNLHVFRGRQTPPTRDEVFAALAKDTDALVHAVPNYHHLKDKLEGCVHSYMDRGVPSSVHVDRPVWVTPRLDTRPPSIRQSQRRFTVPLGASDYAPYPGAYVLDPTAVLHPGITSGGIGSNIVQPGVAASSVVVPATAALDMLTRGASQAHAPYVQTPRHTAEGEKWLRDAERSLSSATGSQSQQLRNRMKQSATGQMHAGLFYYGAGNAPSPWTPLTNNTFSTPNHSHDQLARHAAVAEFSTFGGLHEASHNYQGSTRWNYATHRLHEAGGELACVPVELHDKPALLQPHFNATSGDLYWVAGENTQGIRLQLGPRSQTVKWLVRIGSFRLPLLAGNAASTVGLTGYLRWTPSAADPARAAAGPITVSYAHTVVYHHPGEEPSPQALLSTQLQNLWTGWFFLHQVRLMPTCFDLLAPGSPHCCTAAVWSCLAAVTSYSQ